MRVLILTSSGGTAHDAAAYSIKNWLLKWDPDGSASVEHLLEKASLVMRASVNLYNWIQKHWPWLHKIYWRLVEFEDLVKPSTVLFGRSYFIRLLKHFRPEVIISTHPHINRGHFDLAKRILGESLRCITCCTELDGGFGFSRNWVSQRTDSFWALTQEVKSEVIHRGISPNRVEVLGPLFDPAFESVLEQSTNKSAKENPLPLIVLGAGANGSNNHLHLLNALLPLSGRIRIVALCGKRKSSKKRIDAWHSVHPEIAVEAVDFQSPEQMAILYKKAWVMVARPGARTATEAIASGCVLIFNGFGSTMPQELLARYYFSSRGIDISINKPEDLMGILSQWLEDPKQHRLIEETYNCNQLKGNLDGIKKLILGMA
ncbi:MGDG synthase family glycosyltransferase [Prochlorococcus sp. MIT 1341]|uniref:MGDG synthase family glycosyltransferase n=1 Tax=Prochlorococcus sp. MIT 1341 TaxID=3096221 RepID=UPI002A75E0E9|nr:glycosyltransferase [Prochlorococcus sp. MIT 1341]